MKTVKSSCRICMNCGFDFQVQDNKIVSFTPDFEHPHTRGYCCPKGISGIEFQQGVGGKRLSDSLKRADDGSLEPVDTLAAASDVGKKLKAIIDEHGPRSVALFFGTGGYANTLGNAFSKGWLHAIGSPNFFSTFTIDQSSHVVTAGRMGAFLGGTPNLDDIDVGLVSGANPLVGTAGWPHIPLAALNPGEEFKAIRERGMKLIVVDPRKTEIAERADIHLQLIPGEDATLNAGIIRLMLENNWYNKAFCERFVDNIDRLKQMVEPYDENYVAQRTGVSADQLREAAELFGTAKRPLAGSSTGTSFTPDSNLADFLVQTLNALCGGYRRAGETVSNPCYLSNVGGTPMEAVFPPNRTWEQEPKCRTQDVGKIGGEFPTALFPQEVLQPGKDKIRAVVIFGSNPVMCMPEPHKVIEAFKDLDLMVTLDNTLTETAELSDYVFATTPQYESHDLNGMMEAMYLEPYVQYFPPVVDKPKNVAHDWQIFWTFAKEMGAEIELKHITLMTPFEHIPSCGMVDMGDMPSSEDLLRQMCESKGIDFDALKSAPRGIKPDLPDVQVIAPPEDTPADIKDARLDVCPPDIAEHLQQLRVKPVVESRYRLSARRLTHLMNSQYRDSNFSRAKLPGNLAYMNPDDMARDGLADGVHIDIKTDTGQIIGVVKSDETVREGVISMVHCYGSPLEKESDVRKGVSTGDLIPLSIDDSETINYMPRLTGFPVSIELRQ